MPDTDHEAVRLFERLSREEFAPLRAGVARTVLLDPNVLADLTADPNAMVRQSVAENPRTPPEALVALAAEPGWRMQVALVRNASTPESVVAQLAASPVKVVRDAVAARREGRSGPGPGSLFPALLASLVASAAAGSEADLADAVELWAAGLWQPTRGQERQCRAGAPAARRMVAYCTSAGTGRGGASAGYLLRRWQQGLDSQYGVLINDLCDLSSNGLPVQSPSARILAGASSPAAQLGAGARHADRWFRLGCALHPLVGSVVESFLEDADPLVSNCAQDLLWRALEG